MSDSATSSVGGNTYPMSVGNMTFMLDRLNEDCSPLQFLRELTQNSIESIQHIPNHDGEIHWDVDWLHFHADNQYKLSVIDNGVGMTGPEMVKYINKLSSSIHQQSKHGNFGMGAKIAAAPLNPEGMLYLSWKDGKGSMIHLWKDPLTGEYGLKRHDNNEFYTSVKDGAKPKLIKDHGTAVVLLGRSKTEDTMVAPPNSRTASRWIFRYLNDRYFRFPDNAVVKSRENYKSSRDAKHNMLRIVHGMEYFLKDNCDSSGSVELENATAHWWVLSDGCNAHGHYRDRGHIATLLDDEMYEVATGGQGITRLQTFGVIAGASRVVIYIEPQYPDGRLTSNTPRTALLLDGEGLPWSEWAAEFREKMPEEITELIESILCGDRSDEARKSIRERLKAIRELFQFSRYRKNPQGAEMMDEDAANAGGNSDRDDDDATSVVREPAATSSRGRSSNGPAGNVYALFAAGDTNADAIEGMSEPIVQWKSLEDGTRDENDLDDRAAKYLQDQNIILANADFRVFTDMMERWKRKYVDDPNAEPIIKGVVKEWFEQQLIETVMGALALRKSGKWSDEEVPKLWSEEALTSAVLPRYHVDAQIKRTLGQKVGSLRRRQASEAESAEVNEALEEAGIA